MMKLRKEKKGKKWLKLKPLLPVAASYWVDPGSREWMRKPWLLSLSESFLFFVKGWCGFFREVMKRITSNTRELQRKREKMMRRRRKDKGGTACQLVLIKLVYSVLSPHTLSLSLQSFSFCFIKFLGFDQRSRQNHFLTL